MLLVGDPSYANQHLQASNCSWCHFIINDLQSEEAVNVHTFITCKRCWQHPNKSSFVVTFYWVTQTIQRKISQLFICFQTQTGTVLQSHTDIFCCCPSPKVSKGCFMAVPVMCVNLSVVLLKYLMNKYTDLLSNSQRVFIKYIQYNDNCQFYSIALHFGVPAVIYNPIKTSCEILKYSIRVCITSLTRFDIIWLHFNTLVWKTVRFNKC